MPPAPTEIIVKLNGNSLTQFNLNGKQLVDGTMLSGTDLRGLEFLVHESASSPNIVASITCQDYKIRPKDFVMLANPKSKELKIRQLRYMFKDGDRVRFVTRRNDKDHEMVENWHDHGIETLVGVIKAVVC